MSYEFLVQENEDKIDILKDNLNNNNNDDDDENDNIYSDTILFLNKENNINKNIEIELNYISPQSNLNNNIEYIKTKVCENNNLYLNKRIYKNKKEEEFNKGIVVGCDSSNSSFISENDEKDSIVNNSISIPISSLSLESIINNNTNTNNNNNNNNNNCNTNQNNSNNNNILNQNIILRHDDEFLNCLILFIAGWFLFLPWGFIGIHYIRSPYRKCRILAVLSICLMGLFFVFYTIVIILIVILISNPQLFTMFQKYFLQNYQ